MLGLVLVLVLTLGVFATPVYAQAAAPELKLNVKTKALVTEKTYELKVYNLADNQTVTFKSDHPEFASVDENGLVSANAVGTAIITATVKSAAKTVKQLECEITVGPPAISVKLTQPTIILMDGRKALLKTILQPLNTVEKVKFSSLDNLIASVSSAGRITARSIGTTYIVAAIDNGKYDTCQIIVVDEASYQALLDNPDIDPLTLIPLETNDPESSDNENESADTPAVTEPAASESETEAVTTTPVANDDTAEAEKTDESSLNESVDTKTEVVSDKTEAGSDINKTAK
jgi:hypothetical protein